MKHETQSVPETIAPVDSDQPCAWSRETYDPLEGELPTPPERCATGKPALFYNCNESDPVCEDHVCRCRPSLLTERAEQARRYKIERVLRNARELHGLGYISDETLALILRDLGEPNQKRSG
jgi:hypothetical protein